MNKRKKIEITEESEREALKSMLENAYRHSRLDDALRAFKHVKLKSEAQNRLENELQALLADMEVLDRARAAEAAGVGDGKVTRLLRGGGAKSADDLMRLVDALQLQLHVTKKKKK